MSKLTDFRFKRLVFMITVGVRESADLNPKCVECCHIGQQYSAVKSNAEPAQMISRC